MKIKKLVVKNYKVFDHLELDFTDKNGEVLDTIVLAGLNGSGKTTVLELLTDLIDGTFTYSLSEIELELLLKKNKKYETTAFSNRNSLGEYLSIKPYSPDYDLLEFKHLPNFIDKSELINGKDEFDYLAGTINHIFYKSDEPFADGKVLYFHSNKKTNQNSAKEKFVTQTSFNIDNINIQNSVLNIIKIMVFANPDLPPRQIFNKYIENLNIIFKNLNINSKLVQVSEKDLIFESVNGKRIGFDDLSSGEKILYFMGFTLTQYNLQDALIMVDEPEDSLHPKWQQQIVRFFQNIGSNNQVILATHSPQIIASVRPESLFVLAIDDEAHRVTAINMADEHKHTYGVDPNRILSEIMGAPIRDFETQQRINDILGLIKKVEFNPSVSGVSEVEKEINLLAEDLGKQDASIMRFRNEILLLKRKLLVAQ